MGLGSLISVAREGGHKVHFIDNYLKSEDFIQRGFLQKNKIDLVGISANTICYRDALRMFHAIDMLRKKGPGTGQYHLDSILLYARQTRPPDHRG